MLNLDFETTTPLTFGEIEQLKALSASTKTRIMLNYRVSLTENGKPTGTSFFQVYGSPWALFKFVLGLRKLPIEV